MKRSTPRALLFASLTGLLFLSAPARAQSPEPAPPHEAFGLTRAQSRMDHIEIRNLRDERLGRIKELAVDLPSGRIVEVLVVSGDFLGMGGKVVAVPPSALIPDFAGEVFWLNVSKAHFDASPAIDLSNWGDHGRSDKVAAVYRRFGLEPYFLETGETTNLSDARPLVRLGPIARSSRILRLRVANSKGETFGKVWGLKFDMAGGRVLGVIVQSTGKVMGKRVVPAMALSYSPDRDYLLLDDTQQEFANEPAYHATPAANGQKQKSQEETAITQPTTVALEQGVSYRDIDRTVLINREIRAARLPARHIEVATLHGRVTLRGWVPTEVARVEVARIAVGASRLELVDNQLVVGARPDNALTGRR